MKSYDIKRLANILAVEAEIQGMIAENKQREVRGDSMAYSSREFNIKARELRTIASEFVKL